MIDQLIFHGRIVCEKDDRGETYFLHFLRIASFSFSVVIVVTPSKSGNSIDSISTRKKETGELPLRPSKRQLALVHLRLSRPKDRYGCV